MTRKFGIVIILSILSVNILLAQKDFILRLNGQWKFSIGDNTDWAEPGFEDTQWESINVPSTWEDQGFFGYDGYAWYRKTFSTVKDMRNKDIYISLGYIDDVDQVYVNGKLIGFSGTFPPHFSTVYESLRVYPVPSEFLNFQGNNVIAIRVYDHHMSGGIISGDIGFFTYRTFKPEISMNGLWEFKAGDNAIFKDPTYNDKNWKQIVVPGNWKNQGYKEFNGIAWYRKNIVISDEYEKEKLIFVVGKIDHCDEVYINGELIGKTSEIPQISAKKDTIGTCNEVECSKPRVYLIPENLIRINKENTVSIRVYNIQFRGGLVDGPVGIVKLSTYNRFLKEKGENDNTWPAIP